MQHRKPNRLKHYDYSQAGWYFVTICTHQRIPCFGAVNNGVMELSRPGEIARECWLEIPDHFDIIELDDFVIMPNHVHGIIIIHDVGDVGDVHGRPLRRPHMLLSTVVQHYKAAVSKWSHRMGIEKLRWQRSFYDRVIRNDRELFNIRRYIQNNPLKWEFDRENQNQISLADKKKFWREFFRDQMAGSS